MSQTTYFSNFDNTKFKSYDNTDSNRLISDPCAIQAKAADNSKKLKFLTTNHIDLLEGKEKMNFFGIGIHDTLFVPSDKIDNYSNLLNGTLGGELTNFKQHSELGQLPISTMPFRGQLFHGDVDIEDSMRNEIVTKKNACLPRDTEFYDRSFAIFNNKLNIDIPLPLNSVETSEDGFLTGRLGIPSRFINRYT